MAKQTIDPKFKKIGRWLVIPCSVLIIVLAVLYLLGVWEDALLVCMPLTGVNMLFYTCANWKTNRGIAIFNLVAAVFVFICTVIALFIK